MKFNVPKIFKKLAFSEYAAEFGDAHLDVWVNPPQELYLSWLRNVKESRSIIDKRVKEGKPQKADEEKEIERLKALDGEIYAFYAAILHEDGKPLTTENVKEIFDSARDTDPAFPNWMVDHLVKAIIDHREARKN